VPRERLQLILGTDAATIQKTLDDLEARGVARKGRDGAWRFSLGGSKTAMASSADQFMPTANKVGPLGAHGGGVGLWAGAEMMSPLLEAAGVPPIAAHALGVGAGLGWNKLGVPAINAGRTAAQTAWLKRRR
jgi:hypothetical protein